MSSLSTDSSVMAPSWSRAFSGVWRLTSRRSLTGKHALALAGMLVPLAVVCFGMLLGSRNGPQHYVNWVATSYITFLVPIVAFITAGGVMRDEMKSGTVDYILTRPVRRPAFIGFKFLSHLVCAQVDFLFALALITALGVWKGVPQMAAVFPSLLLAQALTVTAFTALGFFCGALTTRYVVVGLIYAGIVEVGIGQIPTQLSRLSMTRQIAAMLHSLLDGSERVTAQPSTPTILVVGILLLFSVVMVALTALLFSSRELANTSEA